MGKPLLVKGDILRKKEAENDPLDFLKNYKIDLQLLLIDVTNLVVLLQELSGCS